MKIPYFSWLFLIPICSLFVSFGIFVVSGQCLGDQRSYLLDLKNSLPNNTWSTKLVRWNESADCCFWEGVTCSREGRVIGLNLFNESITAGLDSSSSLFSLQYLENLNLAYNCFNSPIPKEFRKLKNLSYLNLSNACFAGQIPNAISSLTRLVTLDLSTNYFLADSTLKLEDPNLAMLVQNLSELKELYLDGVTISVQGYEWCQALSSSLPNLRVLSMSGCSLSGPFEFSLSKLQFLSIISLHNNPFYAPVPEFFANFTNLTSLELSFCGLNGTFPKKIFQIQTLQKLDLSGNDLLQGSLPEFLSNGSLRSLLLGSTNFSGTLPNSISNLTMLSRIDLSLCNFSGSIPSSMANLTQLVYLDMSSNNFTGPIPSFSMAKNLTQIYLSFNHLTGKIHFLNWEGLLNLVNLELSHNSLEGYIPVSLFSLPSLQILRLSNNHFSGQLNEFSNVSSCQLKTLDLSSNYLEGPIPMSIFELQGIEILLLSSNKFNGSLQFNVIQQLRNLFDLDLSYNSLLIEYNGTSSSLSSLFQVIELKLASCKLKIFPDFLINLSNLTTLDLSNNQIHGEIPNWIWKFNKLTHLDLSFNQLVMKREGPLLSLSSLTTLNFLDLHSNQLEGKLPVLPPYATYLDFSINNFNSVIPASIGDSLGVAYFFSISSNKFHGDIPQSLCYATYLQVLNLSNNTLNGTIPQCLIEMSKNLGVLDVRRNKLSGTISDMFPDNCGFQTLNLNGNLLEGVVPRSLANCRNLEVFDIGNNHIEDAFPCYLRSISKLRVLVLRSNKFYGPINCGGTSVNWPMLQIVDLASNKFTGQLQIKSFSTKAMLDDEDKDQPMLNHIQFEVQFSQYYYQDAITVTCKGQDLELVKILTIFTSIDVSCNNLEGPIPEKIGELKSLYVLNLSHNSFTDSIPPSLGKLSNLESLDLSSNRLTGAIPMQLADGLTFLSVLNLSFNQLVGQIPQIKQFATFLETSYEGNKGLYGFPLECKHDEPGALPPTFEETHSKSWIWTDWKNYISAELGFIFGFWVVVGPLVYWKRWRIQYYKHVDDILIKIFPQLNL
ncbi:receptor-like protein 7 [Quercus suber]|uniref:receptor-like protein 7 n=1 Tax=Quercus suber TaxID=58331 RepID=UPI000CE1C33F|nr:receptor-like protein Cf-9 homolog [Quercus suber]